MIEIRGIKVRVEKGQQELEHQIMRKLRCKELPSYTRLKRSIDARKKPELYIVYTVDVNIKNEEKILKRCRDKDVFSVCKNPIIKLVF